MSSRWIFRRTDLRERHAGGAPITDKNPERGFYHVYTYDITEKEVEEDWVWSLCRDERLALVLLDIGKCAHRALSVGELAKAGRIFALFRDNGMQMIVRVVYDRVGRGPEHEPGELGQVTGHIRQLAPLFAAFSAHILTIQGLLVGSWGEMHDSKFLDRASLLMLFDAMGKAAGDIPISVRKPQFQRILQLHNSGVGVGLYDDAILASDTDMGTFGWIDDADRPDIMWTPQRELEFMKVQNARTLCGGEVLAGALAHDADEVLARLALMQVTYLNSVHEPVVWERWRSPEHPGDGGRPLSDVIRERLGYRYELADVELTDGVQKTGQCGCADLTAGAPESGRDKAGDRLRITIANSGFACCYDPVCVVLECGRIRMESVFDGRRLAAGGRLDVEFDIREACAAQGGQELFVCVALRHEKTGLPIYFANARCADQWERYRRISSLPAGAAAGVLLRVKEAIS